MNFNQKSIESIQKDGSYFDPKTRGLFLLIQGGHKSWVYKRMVQARAHKLGLGGLRSMTLSQARAEARKLNAMTKEEFLAYVDQRKNARGKRTKNEIDVKTLTFEKVAQLFMNWNIGVKNWEKEGKAHKVFLGRMKNYVFPAIGHLGIDEVSVEDVAKIVTPIWHKGETVNRCLRFTKNVFDWAIAKKYRTKGNPADRTGALKYLLPQIKVATQNRGALPVARLPEFMAYLHEKIVDGASFQCGFFEILTATRSKTARLAKWEQIDFEKREWLIPPEQLKVSDNGSLIVPLAPQVIEFLHSIEPDEAQGLIFPNKQGNTLSDTMISRIVKELEEDFDESFVDEAQELKLGKPVRATMHGIARATFRTWAQDDSLGNDKKFDPRVAELCLHHKVNDGYGGAYERNKSFLRRIEMMNDWASFCFSKIVQESNDQ